MLSFHPTYREQPIYYTEDSSIYVETTRRPWECIYPTEHSNSHGCHQSSAPPLSGCRAVAMLNAEVLSGAGEIRRVQSTKFFSSSWINCLVGSWIRLPFSSNRCAASAITTSG